MADRPTLTTSRLELSPLEIADAAEMVDVLGGTGLYEFTGGRAPTLDELEVRYSRQVVGGPADGSEEWHNWIVRRRIDDVAVGYVQATISDAGKIAEVAWVIGADFQRTGFAVEAATAMVEWLTGHRRVTRVAAHIHPDHVASIRVAERIGLRPTDRFDDGERLWDSLPRATLPTSD